MININSLCGKLNLLPEHCEKNSFEQTTFFSGKY